MDQDDIAVIILVIICTGVSSMNPSNRSDSNEILVKCSGLELDDLYNLVFDYGIDIGNVVDEGKVGFSVTDEKWKEMKSDISGCEAVGDVEQILSTEVSVNDTQTEWFEEYHSLEDLVMWYEELSKEYPEITTFVESIGKSVEGRNIPAFHITASSNPKKFFFQCLLHPREWITGAVCSYIAHYLVTSYYVDERVTKLLNKVEFILLPVLNPDGYKYSWTIDRLWRKNRRPTSGGLCDGVDLNRNYPVHWSEVDSSINPWTIFYQGEGPASEPETQASMNYFHSQSSPFNPILGAIDWHSYDQAILRPYGWTSKDSMDDSQLEELADKMSDAIFYVNGRLYTNHKSADLCPTSGSADDWFYSDDGNMYNGKYRSAAYTIELPDLGEHGFLLPPSQIISTGKEIVAGVIVFAESLLKSPLMK